VPLGCKIYHEVATQSTSNRKAYFVDAVIDFDLAEQVIAKAHVRSSAIKGLINLV